MFAMQTATASLTFCLVVTTKASSWAETASREQPNSSSATCIAAASGALAGRCLKPRKPLARLRQLNPDLRISNLKELVPIRRPQDFDRWADGLRRAGLPE